MNAVPSALILLGIRGIVPREEQLLDGKPTIILCDLAGIRCAELDLARSSLLSGLHFERENQ